MFDFYSGLPHIFNMQVNSDSEIGSILHTKDEVWIIPSNEVTRRISEKTETSTRDILYQRCHSFSNGWNILSWPSWRIATERELQVNMHTDVCSMYVGFLNKIVGTCMSHQFCSVCQANIHFS